MAEIPETVKIISSLALFAALIFLIYCVMTGNDGELKTTITGIIIGLFATLGIGNIFINNKKEMSATVTG